MIRIGSLFSGYGGLDLGVQAVLGGGVAWHCEIEPGPSKVLAHHHPGVPNLGDITVVDWAKVEPVDVLTGGFPCQDVSSAGRRAGLTPGTRSGLWNHMADAIDALRPSLVVIENVRGLLSARAHSPMEPCPWCVGDGTVPGLRALGAVLGDLADLGYDASWLGIRASDAGAPHARFRVFVIAWTGDAGPDTPGLRRGSSRWNDGLRTKGLVESTAADAGGGELQRRRVAGFLEGASGSGEGEGPERQRDRDTTRDGGADAPDAHSVGPLRGRGARRRRRGPAYHDLAPADTEGQRRRQGRPEPAGLVGGPDAALSGCATVADAVCDGREGHKERDFRAEAGQPAPRRGDAAGRVLDWGAYEPAIRRWESAIGRPAPAPTMTGARGGQQLSPLFVEWMMGLPAGHVTAVPGLSRNEQLKMLGNGVVPQQAELALRRLLAASGTAVAA